MPATEPNTEKLLHLHTLPALVSYLVEELHWPITVDAWEDAFFDWSPDELNLKAEHEVAIRGIKQLRPLASNQPWGIFFVDFDKRQLPIVVLRRVLNGLAIKRRTTGGGHQTWHARDLLFISSFGEGTTDSPREIALAHFSDESDVGDLPTLRVLGWDAADTPLELRHVAATLKSKLIWPQATQTQADLDAWRAQWAGAFRLQKNQVINDSKSLALALAELAKNIRRRVTAVLNLESERGQLRVLHKAFKDNLIADLTEDGFADMYAQTITYGLFAARASRGSGALVADDAALMVPSTNPFLRDLLRDFLTAGGRAHRRDRRVDFDELGINEVVQTLRDVPMDAVLRAFNNDKPGDDPVIHFYEDFLKAYDKKLRAKRGVFYTPRPVVQFIVRSIDEILKTEFHIKDGLASTITWGEYLLRLPLPQAGEGRGEGGGVSSKAPLQLPAHCTANTPFVQILDPATGTATFLVEIIDLIHRHMKAKWRKNGCLTEDDFKPRWNGYVRDHLLPRLYGFELMMAPYAIAHMKIGLKLAETGYTFPEDGPRVKVFLTNALEPAHPLQPQLETMAPMLAHEAASANEVKERLAATVITGNPPYSRSSWNRDPWAESLIDDFKTGLTDSESQIQALSNDYIKFLGLAISKMRGAGVGVLGMITGHGYLHGTQPRVLRRKLLQTFSKIDCVDLHGSQKRDISGSGADESIFEILTGVAVILARATPISTFEGCIQLDVTGSRQSKTEWLLQVPSSDAYQRRYVPNPPNYFYSPSPEGELVEAEYELFAPLPELFGTGRPELDKEVAWAIGFATQQDDLAISFSSDLATSKVEQLASATSFKQLSEAHRICSTSQWDFDKARSWARTSTWSDDLTIVNYRPFDHRWTVFDKNFVTIRRIEVMQHFEDSQSLGLICSRAVNDAEFKHAFVSRRKTDKIFLSGKSSTNAYVFPIWRFVDRLRVANVSARAVSILTATLHLPSSAYQPEAPTAPLHAEKIFHYIYAVLHSPTYRSRYASFLRTDFPRIPMPGSRAVFDALAALGAELVAWHLLEHEGALRIHFSASDHPHPSPLPRAGEGTKPAWFGADRLLAKVAEQGRALAELTSAALPLADPSTSSGRTDREGAMVDTVGKVFVNATSGFADVRLAVWQHTIGGYQVLHKWLDDRRKAGRSLSDDDITHWLRVYAALEATQRLMQQVDAAIDAHGGWPTEADGEKLGGAFSLNHPPPDAATLAVERATLDQQLKAQKKATKAAAKNAQHNGVGATTATGGLPSTMSLFGADADLDDLAAAAGDADELGYTPASGEAPRPKRDATPALAAGGAASASAGAKATATGAVAALRIEDVTDWEMMCAVRAVLAHDGTVARDALIRSVAHELGFARTGTNIASALDGAIRRAVRRGIAQNQASELSLVARNIEGYNRAFLKAHLISVLSNSWTAKAEVPTAFARMLGFARTGAVIEETVWNLMKAVIRAGDAEVEGRGDAALYRRARR